MSGWKALPGELDPDVRAFTERLRRLVDRSGLAVTALADRTGHERSAWDAYLDALLPVPRGAVLALAEATGDDPAALTAQWRHADRAWAVLGAGEERAGRDEAGPGPGPGDPDRADRADVMVSADDVERYGFGGAARAGGGAETAHRDDGDRTLSLRRVERHGTAPVAGRGRPPRTPAGPAPGTPLGGAGAVHGGPVPAPGPAPGPRTSASDLGPRASGSGPGGPAPGPRAPVPGSVPASGPPAPASRRRTVLLYAAGITGSSLVVTAALLLVDLGGSGATDDRATAPPPATAPPTTRPPSLPPGVRCAGADCAGRDPEGMGCGGDLAVTVAGAQVGAARVEVRYSRVCGAAWARIGGAAPGDTVTVTASGAERSATVVSGTGTAAAGAYTPMVAVGSGTAARACGTLADGGKGCTTTPDP
ncbi:MULTISPECIES: DUF2690 domain-containing protein [unclassified Streptomyces]|uniref:DUF2690 domain-containing protein n=1 Tax=unclassified Streptomyces TaxID=2593676 RepID=UPI0037F7ED74